MGSARALTYELAKLSERWNNYRHIAGSNVRRIDFLHLTSFIDDIFLISNLFLISIKKLCSCHCHYQYAICNMQLCNKISALELLLLLLAI